MWLLIIIIIYTHLHPYTPTPTQYPEHHNVGHAAIDLHFRNAPGPIHKAVDLREDYVFALMHFKELCGHGPQASLVDCIDRMAVRAKSAGLSLSISTLGDVCCTCLHVSHIYWVQSNKLTRDVFLPFCFDIHSISACNTNSDCNKTTIILKLSGQF